MAKRLLDQKGLGAHRRNASEDFFEREDVVAKFPTARTFPIIVIDNEYIGGYNELNKRLQ